MFTNVSYHLIVFTEQLQAYKVSFTKHTQAKEELAVSRTVQYSRTEWTKTKLHKAPRVSFPRKTLVVFFSGTFPVSRACHRLTVFQLLPVLQSWRKLLGKPQLKHHMTCTHKVYWVLPFPLSSLQNVDNVMQNTVKAFGRFLTNIRIGGAG